MPSTKNNLFLGFIILWERVIKKYLQMKKIILTLVLIVTLLFMFVKCERDNFNVNYQGMLDSLSASKYYTAEILGTKNMQLYGTWKVVGTSGGIAGSGYTPDFDYLVIKAYGVFGLIRNDSLITSGKIAVINQTDTELSVDFISETDPVKVGANIVLDPEKYIIIQADTLDLNSPCCDRFNTRLIKVR